MEPRTGVATIKCVLTRVCDENNQHMITCPGTPQNMEGHWVLVLDQDSCEQLSLKCRYFVNIFAFWLYLSVPEFCDRLFYSFVLA